MRGSHSCRGRLTLHCPGEKDKHMKRNQLEVTSKALNTESSAQASEEEKQSERTQLFLRERNKNCSCSFTLSFSPLHTCPIFSIFLPCCQMCGDSKTKKLCLLYFYKHKWHYSKYSCHFIFAFSYQEFRLKIMYKGEKKLHCDGCFSILLPSCFLTL